MQRPTIRNRDLAGARDALGRLLAVARTPRLALRVQRLYRAADDALQDLIAAEDAILERNGALKDEKGFVPKTSDSGMDVPGTVAFHDPEGEASAWAEQRALFAESTELEASSILLSLLETAGVSFDDGFSADDRRILAELTADDTAPLTTEENA